jgi:hypothetical protein
MRRWWDGEGWADRWEPVEGPAARKTAEGVQVLTVIAIVVVGVLVFLLVLWMFGASADSIDN